MSSRYFVYHVHELFGVVHAENNEQAVLKACRMTDRVSDPTACVAKKVVTRNRCRPTGPADDTGWPTPARSRCPTW